MASPSTDPSAKNPAAAFRRAAVVVVVCTALGASIGYFTTTKPPQRYACEALLLATMGREVSAARSDLAATGNVRRVVSPGWREFINTEVAMLKSANILQRTKALTQQQIQAHLKGEGPPPEEEAVSDGLIYELRRTLFRPLKLEFEGDPEALRVAGAKALLSASLIPRSNVMRLQCVAEDSDVAALMVQNWIDLYMNAHILTYTQAGDLKRFEKQKEESAQRVAAVEAQITEFRTSTGFFDIEGVKQHLLDQKADLEAQIRENRAAIDAERARIGELDKRLAEVPEQTLLSTTTASNEELLAQLRELATDIDRLAGAESAGGELGRLGTALRSLASRAGGDSSDTVEGRNPIHDFLSEARLLAEANQHGLEARKTALDAGLAELVGQLAELEKARPENTKLIDDLASAMLENENMTEAVRIGRLSRRLDKERITNVRVIAPPSPQPLPNLVVGLAPEVLNALTGGLLGFLISVCYFFGIRTLREAGVLKKA